MLTSLVLVCGRTRSRSKKSPVPKKRTRCRRVLGFSKNNPLFLDSVLALEHIINLGKVVGTRGDGRGVTLRSVALLEMGLLSEVAHLNKTIST